MRFNKFLILPTAFLFLTACGSGETETPKNSANTNTTAPANTVNSTNPNSNNPIAVSTATPEQTTNTAETVKPVVTAYYQALKTKDDAALRKIYSKETLASLESDMKAEGKKSLIEFITEIEPVPDKPFEVRNETIQGDTAIAEIRSSSYPNGIKIKFVKENGEWKMTNESPEFPKK